ncbi:Calx-beta domain-containing protein [Maribacter spongiicola]|uniref:Calx-beta domain-containing protein n=1 Tax=Maribacter spongiicola TaxID=1206753 RepID=UPI003F980F1D
MDLEHHPALLSEMIKNAMKIINKIELRFKHNSSRLLMLIVFIFFTNTGFSQVATLSVSDADASESNGLPNPGQFQITLTNGFFPVPSMERKINVIVEAGLTTALANLDRAPISSTLTIPAGQTVGFIDLDIIDDALVEGDEILFLSIEPGDNYTQSPFLSGRTQSITVVDNDFALLDIGDVQNTEGNNLVFNIRSDKPVEYAHEVTVNFSGGTATKGSSGFVDPDDYNGDQRTVTFLPGEVTKQMAVVTGNDTTVEDDETFIATLTSDNNASVTAGDTGIGTILNDDFAQVTVVANRPNTNEDGTGNNGRFRIELSEENDTGGDIIVGYTFSGSATVGDDFTISGNAIIPDGSDFTNINIIPVNDADVEGDETVVITLNSVNSVQYEIGTPNTDAVTIVDDDVVFIASIASTDATANESPLGNGVFTIDLGATNNTGSPIVVNYTRTGTATSGADFTALTGSVSIPNGQRTGLVTITPINDTDIESNETVILTLAAGTGYTVGTPISATVVIVSEDANVAQIIASDGTAAESNGAVSPGEFTVSLSAPNNTAGPIIVNYVVSGTAGNGVDYTAINANAVSIPVGEQQAEIDILPINDAIQEGAETVILTLATGTGYVLGSGPTRTATVQINDNDQATLTISDESVNEDVTSGVIVFDVVLDLAVVGGTTVTYSFINDTAINGTDYTGTNGSLTFTGTVNEIRTITVPINNDAILENTETFTVQLGLPTNNVQRANSGTATGTIQDDDNCVAAPTLDTSVSNIYCVEAAGDDFSANLFDFTSSAAPAGTVLTWSRVSNPLNTNSHLTVAEAQDVSLPASYYGFFYDAANNCASGTIEVQIVRNVLPQLVTVNDNERCGPGTLLLSVVPTDGASINWYDSIDAVTPIAMGETYTTPSLNATATYYVEATENECTTERQPVVARIGSQATTGTAQNGSICNVAANGLTSIDLDTRLVGADPGVWVFVSGPQNDVTISSTNVVQFEGFTSGGYIFRFTTTDSTAPCVNPTVDVTINVSDCETDDDNDGLLGGQEVALGTDSNNPDTDGDGIEDGVEVGDDIANPLDEDGDGIIDALDSNTADADNDGVNDQQDPANSNPCIPNRFNGNCDTDGDGISDLDEQTNGSDPDDPCDPVASPNCDAPIDLEVLKSVDNIDALVGDTIIFKILVTNLSDRTARAIVVGDFLELGFDFVSSDAPEATDYDAVSGNWSIAELAAGISLELSITVIVAEQGPYTNTAVLLESIPSDNNAENDEATVVLNTEAPEGVDLKIEKEARPDKALVGDEVEFIIRVTNISESDAVTDIVVNDLILIENGFEFVSAESDFGGTYDEASGNWNIPSLNREETATLRIRARVPAIGTYTNTANIVRSTPRDGNTENNIATVTVEVIQKSPADPGFLFNQFSPNGNNQNEILRINRTLTNPDTGAQIEVNLQYKIKIYDRYGNLVFETEKVNDGDVWDGTYKGKESPKGTYFYIMNYSINNQPTVLDKGWIQLIR